MDKLTNPRKVTPGKTFVTTTGTSINFYDFVPKEGLNVVPLLCLHGFMRCSRDFHELGETLAEAGVRVIAPDLRGRGLSSRFDDPAQYHYDLTKQDVVELLDHLRIEHVAIAGIALGAIIAQDLAHELPQRVKGIILNDQGAEIDSSSANKMAGNVQNANYTWDEAVQRMKENFGETYPALTNERWEDMTWRAYREVKPGRWARDFDLLTFEDIPRLKAERPDGWAQFFKTRGTPVALIRGGLSTYFSANCADRMVQEHSETVLTTIEGRGHPPLLEEPRAMAAVLALLGRASG